MSKCQELAAENLAEKSEDVRDRVEKARARQIKRAQKTNSELGPRELKAYCLLDQPSQDLLKHAVNNLNLSARQYTRILKVARTIADLAGQEKIVSNNIAEALQYRPKEQNMY